MENEDYPRVTSVRRLNGRGPWTTKSHGSLSVVFAFPRRQIMREFFTYDPVELDHVATDICGLRLYSISNLQPDAPMGGGEFHRLRQEFVWVVQGSVEWTCADLLQSKITWTLKPDQPGLWMPPFLMHSYRVLEPNTIMQFCCNTLFDPDDPATHDTYPESEFIALQRQVAPPKEL